MARTKPRKRQSAREVEPQFFMMSRAQLLRTQAAMLDLFDAARCLDHQLRGFVGGREPRR